jgi:isoleucyl-tRNA synthetase
VAAGIELLPGEYQRRLVATDTGATAELPRSSGLVVLDTATTPALEAEGVARDLVRVVQQARRDAGLDVADRIALTVQAPADVVDAVRAHEAFVAGETLADSVTYGPATGFKGTVGDGVEVTVDVARA